MAQPPHVLQLRARRLLLVGFAVVLGVLAASCTTAAPNDGDGDEASSLELNDPPRRYNAEWLISAEAVNIEGPGAPFVYREVVDDQTGRYLVQSPDHVAYQQIDEVVLCAAIARIPLDPYCASSPRAENAPNVLSYPIQLLRGWGPRELYDLASYREVSLVAASDPDSWRVTTTEGTGGIGIECFLVTGTTTAAATGFEVCFTDDDLHLVASVDLQNDLNFEIDLLLYTRGDVSEFFETGFEEFIEPRPQLQEQLLDLYPEIPAPRPTPTPDLGTDSG